MVNAFSGRFHISAKSFLEGQSTDATWEKLRWPVGHFSEGWRSVQLSGQEKKRSRYGTKRG